MIKKIKFKNFRKHKNLEVEFNKHINIFVGDNGVGKSTIIEGISYIMNGSFSQIEKIGFENLFNTDIIMEFNSKEPKKINELPELIIELYLEDVDEPKAFDLKGRHNTDKVEAYGLYMKIGPDDDYTEEINEILLENTVFPFEYYRLEFSTFAGQSYNSYKKKHKFQYELIDSSRINSKNRIDRYISNLFSSSVIKDNHQTIRYDFRNVISEFSDSMYEDYELSRLNDYELKVGVTNSQMLDHNMTAYKNNVSIFNQGQGELILLGVESSVVDSNEQVKIILIEEPENHLSYLNMEKLIKMLGDTYGQQMIISTHSNMIASRLHLSNLIMLSDNKYKKFNEISDKTERYFQKSPDNSLLNFILAKKVILVEGTAEYILINSFYKSITGREPFMDNITVISVGGLNFKYYLELAKVMEKKVAVITDNDKNYEDNVKKKYMEYDSLKYVEIYSDADNSHHTFEISMYKNNFILFEEKFKKSQMSNGLQQYMLDNKVEFAMRLLEKIENLEKPLTIVIPEYIRSAINWIM